MSTLGTKDVDISAKGGGKSKTLEPGNLVATLHKVELKNFGIDRAVKKNGLWVILHLEGPDMGEDFEGFFIDKDNESLGRYKGQVGQVKTFNWEYADKTFSNGEKVYRDQSILKDLKRLCIAYGCEDWFTAQDHQHETIESFVEEFNKTCPLVGKKLKFCITGREYYSKDGKYRNWDLVLAPYKNNEYPYESVDVPEAKSKLIKFDEAEHIERAESKKVEQFAGDIETDDDDIPDTAAAGTDEDFEV